MLTDYCITPFSRATTCKTLRMKVARYPKGKKKERPVKPEHRSL